MRIEKRTEEVEEEPERRLEGVNSQVGGETGALEVSVRSFNKGWDKPATGSLVTLPRTILVEQWRCRPDEEVCGGGETMVFWERPPVRPGGQAERVYAAVGVSSVCFHFLSEVGGKVVLWEEGKGGGVGDVRREEEPSWNGSKTKWPPGVPSYLCNQLREHTVQEHWTWSQMRRALTSSSQGLSTGFDPSAQAGSGGSSLAGWQLCLKPAALLQEGTVQKAWGAVGSGGSLPRPRCKSEMCVAGLLFALGQEFLVSRELSPSLTRAAVSHSFSFSPPLSLLLWTCGELPDISGTRPSARLRHSFLFLNKFESQGQQSEDQNFSLDWLLWDLGIRAGGADSPCDRVPEGHKQEKARAQDESRPSHGAPEVSLLGEDKRVTGPNKPPAYTCSSLLRPGRRDVTSGYQSHPPYGSLFLIRISEAVWVCVIRRAQGWGRGESKLDSEKLAGNFVTQRRTGDPSKSHGISAPVCACRSSAVSEPGLCTAVGKLT
ncbi:hypothetical protein Cadr_000004941 [Camelus dromedarius]|uniref:Uncharacterized protein n=1 Tax=Camelus dromedarius TaxID=9838 RepID=A0A5N4EEB3_CAMDR|nr:hypothetical protein Cadr_000004941 [Camelus dromedarius]